MVKYEEVLKKPKETSPKKKWFTEFNCPHCNKFTSKSGKYSNPRFKMELLCNLCSSRLREKSNFIEKAKHKYNNKYNYSYIEYKGKNKSVIIECPIHGKFEQKPRDHLEATVGCQKCAKQSGDNKKTKEIETWAECLKVKTQNKVTIQNYSRVHYHEKVTLHCKDHGSFETSFGAIQATIFVCPKCSYINHQQQSIRPNLLGKPASLYYVYLPKLDKYKLGVTVQSLKERLGNHVLLYQKLLIYEEAIKIEHEVLTALKSLITKDKIIFNKNGYTEMFDTDILPELLEIIRGLRSSDATSKES